MAKCSCWVASCLGLDVGYARGCLPHPYFRFPVHKWDHQKSHRIVLRLNFRKHCNSPSCTLSAKYYSSLLNSTTEINIFVLPWWLSSRESACQCRRCRFHPWVESTGEGNGHPLQYFCLEISMDRGTRQARVHEVTKSGTQFNNSIHIFGWIEDHPLYLRSLPSNSEI